MGRKAKELPKAIHHLQAWQPPDMKGRVRHDTLWARAVSRWKPGTKVWVEFKSPVQSGPNTD